jgi:hypothetical protein
MRRQEAAVHAPLVDEVEEGGGGRQGDEKGDNHAHNHASAQFVLQGRSGSQIKGARGQPGLWCASGATQVLASTGQHFS